MCDSLIRDIEETSINAWPAHQTLIDHGWLLRFAGGYTRRSNSVNPIYLAYPDDGDELLDRIRRCERQYQQRRQPTIFKITPLVQPPHLDSILAGLGYAKEAPTGVRVRTLASWVEPRAGATQIDVEIATTLSDTWIDCFAQFSDLPATTVPVLQKILGNILATTGYALVYDRAVPVACGLAVVDEPFLGLFDIVTALAARGKGHGSRLLPELLTWGQANGAQTAYLQVMDDNLVAQRLYNKLEFKEVYRYWYRVKA